MSKGAPLTETNLPDQTGKIFIVTGSSIGIGKELTQILYSKNAKVYIATRSREKAEKAIGDIKRAYPASKGELVYLHLDLADLTTIKASAEEFLRNETELHVLWNNAGVMIPPQGSLTKQGYELQLGTNNLGPFLFTKLLTPILAKTAQNSPSSSIRCVWVSSGSSKRVSPTTGGVDMSNLDYKVDRGPWYKYGTSKAGNFLHSSEYARRYGKEGIISVCLDPGMLNTDLYKEMAGYFRFLLRLIVLKEPIWGAYTELYAGLSTDITTEDNGVWIEAWGKKSTQRRDIEKARKTEAEGGSGVAKAFWTWSEVQVAPFF